MTLLCRCSTHIMPALPYSKWSTWNMHVPCMWRTISCMECHAWNVPKTIPGNSYEPCMNHAKFLKHAWDMQGFGTFFMHVPCIVLCILHVKFMIIHVTCMVNNLGINHAYTMHVTSMNPCIDLVNFMWNPCVYPAYYMHMLCIFHVHNMHMLCIFHAHNIHILCIFHAVSCTFHAHSMQHPSMHPVLSLKITCMYHACYADFLYIQLP